MSQPTIKPPGWLVYAATIIILVAFLAAFTVGLLTSDWKATEIITPELLLVFGYIFGIQLVKGGAKNGGNSS